MLLKDSAECGGIWETEFVGNLLNCLVCILHQEDTSTDYRPEDELLNSLSAKRLHQHRKIFWRETKLVSIESDAALTSIMFLYEMHKVLKDFYFAVHPLGRRL